MRDEIQQATKSAFQEVAGTAPPVEVPRPPPAQPEQNDRYAITPEKEQFIRRVAQIGAEEKARAAPPDADERTMRLRERVQLEEKDAFESRKAAAARQSPFRRAEEILNEWSRSEITAWYDKQKEILRDLHSRDLYEFRHAPRNYDEYKARQEQAFAEAGVAGKFPSQTREQMQARLQQALEIARAELSQR